MKRYVNGAEIELAPSENVQITALHDRLMVRTPEGTNSALAVRVGDSVHVSYKGHVYVVEKSRGRLAGHGAVGTGELHAPMPGQIVEVLVSNGDTVKKGDKIIVLEAMKTQQVLSAPFDGVVSNLTIERGQQVSDGQLLAVVTELAK
jgi:3-methylcrotonyl-CoA carboxylase alpha subunit